MRLLFGPLQADRPEIASPWDVLLGVVAAFSIEIGEQRFLHEEMFPVVELAVALKRWLDEREGSSFGDFSYDSMESADGPLLEFVWEDGNWAIRSRLQESEERHTLTTEELDAAARQFVEHVKLAVATQLNLDVSRLLDA